MVERCSNQNCFVHDGESCYMGQINHENCSCWKQEVMGAKKSSINQNKIDSRLPWSSATFGHSDLINLKHQGNTTLVGVLGAANSGKTTFLTVNYLSLLAGEKLNCGDICGSFTLGAWEALASFPRHVNSNNQLSSFPPHTPRSTERTPGMLHLGLRLKTDTVKQLLLTDAPGEWFAKWATNADSEDAKGAKWTVEHSDAFLIFADCEKLCGTQRGEARKEVREIIERLSSKVEDRPVMFIWAKSDHQPSNEIQNALMNSLNRYIPRAKVFKVTTKDLPSFTSALNELLEMVWKPSLSEYSILEPVMMHTPYYAFRGKL